MKTNPLGHSDHGTSPAKVAPNVKVSAQAKIIDGKKHVYKPLNAHRAQAGFKGKVA